MPKKGSCCRQARKGDTFHSPYCFTKRDDIPPLSVRQLKSMRRVTPEEHALFSAAVKEYWARKEHNNGR